MEALHMQNKTIQTNTVLNKCTLAFIVKGIWNYGGIGLIFYYLIAKFYMQSQKEKKNTNENKLSLIIAVLVIKHFIWRHPIKRKLAMALKKKENM